MTNPNNAVGTNGAFGGRTSVNAFNDVLALVSKGVVSGWACSPSSGMTVQLGGVAGTRDVAVAEDNAGNKTTVNNISGSPIEVTIANASTTDNMIDYIVAYVSNPPSGDEDVADNPSSCGIISVRGASANTAPTASAIRSAITADGGTGTLAYYVVLAQISVTAGLTTIMNDNISAVDVSGVGSNNIDFTTLINNIYPVGSIYISLNDVSPSEFIGGVWERVAGGRVLVGVDSSNNSFDASRKTGGQAVLPLFTDVQFGYSGSAYSDRMVIGDRDATSGFHSRNISNYPPYITAYMWERVS